MLSAFRVRVLLAIGLLGCVLPLHAALTLPAVPEDRNFTQDYATIIASMEARRAIGALQKTAFEQHDTPIMVVTISSMAQYGGGGYSIERFTNEWFNHWQIGKRGRSGELINRGILLLVSSGDRKARIELGAEWGHRFDAKAARIMNDTIVPEFKKGSFARGITEGVRELAEMAKSGPQGGDSVLERVQSAAERVSKDNPLNPMPGWGVMALFGVGLLLVVASFFAGDEHRKTLLLVGAGLMIAAVLFWVILAVIAFLTRGRLGGSGGLSDSGYSSSGGFETGGYSGGGGASGSW